jgi:tight adherence protein C
MITVFGFQVAVGVVCSVVIVWASLRILRRRRRERLLAQRPHEELHRLDRLQLDLQAAQPKPGELRRDTAVNGGPHSSPNVSNEVFAPLVSPSQSAGTTGSSTTWQEQRLFAPQAHTRWRVSGAIPRVEPHEVPTVDTSDYVFGSATPVLASFLPETDEGRRALARELRQAGDYSPHARENLAATRFLLMIGSLLFGGVCVLLAPPAAERILLVGTLVLTALGWALPSLLVKSRAKSRRTEVERAVPDMMDMLNMCVSQGLTVPDSLERIAADLKSVYPALAQELAIAVDQAKVGTLTEALHNLAERIDLPQVDSFTSLLTQTERMGTSVSDALSDYSNTMRESLRQRADERANQASFSLLFPTVLCLMPAVFLFLMGPAVIELSKFTNAGGLGALSEERATLRNVNRVQLRQGRNANAGQP